MHKRLNFIDRRDIHIPDSGAHGERNKLTKEEKEHIDQLYYNRWSPFLSGSEEKIVKFVYARTVRHWQRWAYCSINMMTFGFPYAEHREDLAAMRDNPQKAINTMSLKFRQKMDEGDIFVVAPTGLSRSNVYTALNSVLTKGFVVRNETGAETEMALNPDAYFNMTEVLFPNANVPKDSRGQRMKRRKLIKL